MSLGVLRSLRVQRGLAPEALAREFAEDYFNDGRNRRYDNSDAILFRAMQNANFENPYRFAAHMFHGAGSFRNGGAMKVVPLAVYALKLDDLEFEKLVVNVTRITHTHPEAIYGALLQAFAVRQVWDMVCCGHSGLFAEIFLNNLLDRLANVQYRFICPRSSQWREAFNEYAERFQRVRFLLDAYDSPVNTVIRQLGTSPRAIESVPRALYAFIRSLWICEVPFNSMPLRALAHVMSWGGDTARTASMACALSGGFQGVGPNLANNRCTIPDRMLHRCEGFGIVKEYTDWLISRFER
ncbi:unnamed protein product [Calicophoron daubneyi]